MFSEGWKTTTSTLGHVTRICSRYLHAETPKFSQQPG